MRGDVTVRAECLMPEKLLERALRQGARFGSVRREGAHALIAECDERSAAILLDLCERFRIPARALDRRGRSALRERAKRRATLPIGLALCVVLCWLFLSRVWLVEVAFSGEAAGLGDAQALLDLARERGIRPGISRQVDLDALGKELQAEAGDYSYVGARLRGIRLVIEAVPEVPSPPLYDVDAARDLVSDRDGIVLSAVARSGELCVQPGDAVRRGQLLIRGEELEAKDATRPIAALGEVIVRAWFTGEASLPLVEKQERFTGRSSASSRLVTPWFSLALADGETYAGQREEAQYLPIGGLFVPIEIKRVTRREVQALEVALDEDAFRDRLSPLAFADAALRLSRDGPADCEVLRRWVDFERQGGRLVARAVIEISADAATTRDALLRANADH